MPGRTPSGLSWIDAGCVAVMPPALVGGAVVQAGPSALGLGLVVVAAGLGALYSRRLRARYGSTTDATSPAAHLVEVAQAEAYALGLAEGRTGLPGPTNPDRSLPPLAPGATRPAAGGDDADLVGVLARRSQALVELQIERIMELEEAEADPDHLAELFVFDHLATRLRRVSETMLSITGDETLHRSPRPVPLVDVVRAAVAETEHYQRADMVVEETAELAGRAVADVSHLLAELVENAVARSPHTAPVTVRCQPVREDGRCVLVVQDQGVGLSAVQLAAANTGLAAARPAGHRAELDAVLSRWSGLAVVARLATRHGIHVSLATNEAGGVSATVVLPGVLFAGSGGAASAAGRGARAQRSTKPMAPLSPDLPASARGRSGAVVPPGGDGLVTRVPADAGALGARPAAAASSRGLTAAAIPMPSDRSPFAGPPPEREAGGAVATTVRPAPHGIGDDPEVLVQRVPRAQLNPLLAERPAPGWAAAPTLIEMRERAEMRSALSSFQRQQRAGRDAVLVEEDRRR